MNAFIKTLVVIFLLLPISAWAATAVVEVDTGTEDVNALEGTLVLPESMRLNEIQTGNSIILFWITTPEQVGNTITFAGMTPGGFMGAYPIFTISGEFGAQDLEKARFESINALKNDGSGTSVPVTVTLSPVELKGDTEPPEDFTPVIASDQALFGGKHFLVFATQDKGSGVAHYEVREGEWGWFTAAASPYLLRHQALDRRIFVKAIDSEGNERVEVVEPQTQSPWYRLYLLFGILFGAIAYFISNFLWRKRTL